MTITLTQDQIDFYHREGYLSLDAITTQEEVAWMRGVYDRLFASRAGREVGDQFDLGGTDEEGKEAVLPQILGPSRYAPELAEGLFRKNAMEIARQLLGPEAVAMGDHAILKPPKRGAETPLHQDESYWDPGRLHTAFSLWIPLQEATVENGCMAFVPKSWELDVLPHHPIGNDPRIHGLEVDDPERFKVVHCPIPAGGATVHHCRTLHYAGPNSTDEPRRAYILGFGVASVPRETPRPNYWNESKQTPREERARQSKNAVPPMGAKS